MKKAILILLLLFSFQIKAQITLEHTFPATADQSISLLYLNLGNDEFKYVIIDYTASKFHIYNLDYSPYQLDIPIASSSEFQIAYITKTLFDCDDSNIEYALTHNFSDFQVYRTDGTLLFSRDNVIAVYCYGCNNGSNVIQPIYNTPNGTKLVLMDNINNSQYIYSLCSELPLGTNDLTENELVTVYPVPNNKNANLNFKINIPALPLNDAKIEVYNSNMQLLDNFQFSDSNIIISKNYSFATGVYFYAVKNSGKVIKTGKFVIQ